MILERSIWALFVGLIFSIGIGQTSEVPNKVNSDLPSIPFEVEYAAYDKTVLVVASCDKRPDSITLYFKPSDYRISKLVYAAINKAFDQPGIKRIQVCRNKPIKLKGKNK